MVSILIPVYNYDVRELTLALSEQCRRCGIEYEILLFDDASDHTFQKINRPLGDIENVIYREMPCNTGRSSIRNALAEAARFSWLLFLDCDSKVVSRHYVKNYLDYLRPGIVLCGGRSYSERPPTDRRFYFHWRYGSRREQIPAQKRNKAPWHGFMTNNFLIPAEVFQKTRFDESLKQYGHEDTLLGAELARRRIPVLHLDNPLEHAGLEPALVFLQKTNQGLENLVQLYQAGKPVNTRLLALFLRLKKWRMAGILRFVFSRTEPLLVKNFLSENPQLVFFDFYKLGKLNDLFSK